MPNILSVFNSKEQGTKIFKGCLCAMKKLAETIGNTNLLGKLKEVDGTQIEFREDLQALSVEDFLTLREQVLNVPLSDKRYKPDSRQCWLWVFSMQLVYGFRVHEVFAVQNIDKPFKTKDGITIPPLNEPANKKMIAVVGEKTLLDTTTRTGYRLCVPMLPPTHFDLIERLEIKLGKLPEVRLLSSRPETVSKVYAKRGRDVLVG